MNKTEEEVEQLANKFVSELKDFTHYQAREVAFKIMYETSKIAVIS
jgi:hypothetical protein